MMYQLMLWRDYKIKLNAVLALNMKVIRRGLLIRRL